ncbi:DNA-directed RNA polymerase II subunit RPB11 [Trichinella zimbabwensis]|uniref:DNA-directed RNA polymerase II subunit RPB11 n=1 Tax=Trichinella zimbabwensis TaxID=268475 RepID=A0A0V1I3K4_9BILA|nr:DNA-directed RNA polymerase II subunit RPB11 [Trichinella zimbabwensis]
MYFNFFVSYFGIIIIIIIIVHSCSCFFKKMNAPQAFESFLLFEGEEKLIVQKETKVPNAYLFTLNKEDHTIGHLIKDHLMTNPKVLFVGFRAPHPLEHKIYLRLQTTPDVHPIRVMKLALSDLVTMCDHVEEKLKEKIAVKKLYVYLLCRVKY